MDRPVASRDLADGRRIVLAQGDITKETVDAIVNAANGQLAHGGGVAAAIARAAGPLFQEESAAWVRAHGPVPTGGAAMTSAGTLAAKAVIHAVGPVWRGGASGEDDALRGAVRASLLLAHKRGFSSIGFPAISSGIYGFPIERCARIMLDEIVRFGKTPPQEIRVVLFDDVAFSAFRQALG